jgi:hypothetical protein
MYPEICCYAVPGKAYSGAKTLVTLVTQLNGMPSGIQTTTCLIIPGITITVLKLPRTLWLVAS